jgi:hypothetical protein
MVSSQCFECSMTQLAMLTKVVARGRVRFVDFCIKLNLTT